MAHTTGFFERDLRVLISDAKGLGSSKSGSGWTEERKEKKRKMDCRRAKDRQES
jgi:hypothetical protein